MEDPLAFPERHIERAPVVYFNGFTIGVGNADFSLQLRIDNEERLWLKCSYTIAKTLAEKMTDVVARFEKATDHNLMTTEEVGESLKNFEGPKDAPKAAK